MLGAARFVPICGALLDDLRRLRDSATSSFVFTTMIGTPCKNNLLRQWKLTLKRAGVEYHLAGPEGGDADLHSLRHTFISKLIEAGVDPKTVQEIAGHSDIHTTLTYYTHTTSERKAEAVAMLPWSAADLASGYSKWNQIGPKMGARPVSIQRPHYDP